MMPGFSAERVNGSSIVVMMTRGTMQDAVKVESGAGMLVGSAGAELTSLATPRREERTTTLICIIDEM